LELETSNYQRKCITRSTNEGNAKLGQTGSERGHVTYFRNFGTSSISRELLELETSNLACRCITRGTNERNAKLGQRRAVVDLQRGRGRWHWANLYTP